MAKAIQVHHHDQEIHNGVPVVPIHALGVREAVGSMERRGLKTDMREVHLMTQVCGLDDPAVFRFYSRADVESFIKALQVSIDNVWPLS